MSETIVVKAVFDPIAKVWVADSADVPGLVAEAATLEALADTVRIRIGELIELNGTASSLPEIPVHLLAEHSMRVLNPKNR
ncbi:MAG: DUF1902 domain-containing protein [Hyphomicrobium aestuarii]|nr:DUF1902 domain-containing protein [Hyphomicrobium aestuarii]